MVSWNFMISAYTILSRPFPTGQALGSSGKLNRPGRMATLTKGVSQRKFKQLYGAAASIYPQGTQPSLIRPPCVWLSMTALHPARLCPPFVPYENQKWNRRQTKRPSPGAICDDPT